LQPFQPNAGPRDEAASKAMLKQIQSLRAGVTALDVREGLVKVHSRFVGALLLYERSTEDRVTTAHDGDTAALALSHAAFDAAQVVVEDAIGSLTALGFDECLYMTP
jgi:hypothetical protein